MENSLKGVAALAAASDLAICAMLQALRAEPKLRERFDALIRELEARPTADPAMDAEVLKNVRVYRDLIDTSP